MSERLHLDPTEKVEYVRYTEAHKRAQEIKAKRSIGREPKDFIGGPLYTKNAIAIMEARVEELDGIFKDANAQKTPEHRARSEQAEMMADCLEGIFLYMHSWLGPTSKAYPTSKYDDYVNRVDLIIERNQGGMSDHNGLAIDVTYGGPKTILKKLKNIRDRVLNGKLGKVDLFKSDDGKYKGQLLDIPLVVVGADANTMKGLINLFAGKEDGQLSEHPFQFQVIDQIILQCDFFIETAKKIKDKDKERSDKIVSEYTKLKQTFEALLKLKQKTIPADVDRNFRDSFHENIITTMNNLRVETEKVEPVKVDNTK